MPFQKGRKKTGGRPKGFVDVAKRTVSEVCAEVGCDPFEGMAMIASGSIPCLACGTIGKVKSLITKEWSLCEVCRGRGFKVVSTDIRLRAYAEIAQYIHPKRKALELVHSGTINHQSPRTVLIDRLAVFLERLRENGDSSRVIEIPDGSGVRGDTVELEKLG